MNRKHGIVMTAVGMAAVMGLSACGSSEKKSDDKKPEKSASAKNEAQGGGGLEKLSGKEISEKAKQELRNATSLRFKMKGAKGPDAMDIDLAVDNKGNCAGTVTSPTTGSAEVIKLGDRVWMKADEKLWKSQANPQVAELLKGRYITGPTSDPKLKGMTSACDLAAMQAKVGDEKESGEIKKGAATTLDGQPVVPISSDGTTISVAAAGRPYPLKIDDSKDGSVVRLTDWNKPVSAKAPPAGQTIDITKLQKSQQGL
ncbi:hypothetical protein [Streptomyces sp. I05A-00742]|uniref:hypothetical protein n=1 Tax=Streptomyces sp. I05A-00742 TaxID=2732853 RepID=UPI00148943FB|nr:hypothetical protein [Streptomyces sp. I05A-00742]